MGPRLSDGASLGHDWMGRSRNDNLLLIVYFSYGFSAETYAKYFFLLSPMCGANFAVAGAL